MKPVKHTGGIHFVQINEDHHEKCSTNMAYKIKTKALINMMFFILCRRIFNLIIYAYEISTLCNVRKYVLKIEEKLCFYEQAVLEYTNNLRFCFACPPEALD